MTKRDRAKGLCCGVMPSYGVSVLFLCPRRSRDYLPQRPHHRFIATQEPYQQRVLATVSVDTSVEAVAKALTVHDIDDVILVATSHQIRVNVDWLGREVNGPPQSAGLNQLLPPEGKIILLYIPLCQTV